VPCAVGGSPIRTWQPGAVFEVEPGRRVHPLDDALQRAAQAGPAGRWCGILWHQGESDGNEVDAPLYEARLRQLLLGLRAALGHAQLPVLIGQMGRWPGKPWTAAKLQVDAAHQRVAKTLGQAAFVGAEGLGVHDDGLQVHFDAAGARELGRRYARALQRLQT
jgi:Carbohydrate esterase, sialic acid-specific acetylesterase